MTPDDALMTTDDDHREGYALITTAPPLPPPTGMPDAEEIVFKYESEQKPGQIPGDVVLKLKTTPHPMFTRSRDSLSMKIAIPLRAALLGFETSFKHLDGHTVTLKRTTVTKPGQVGNTLMTTDDAP